MTHLSAHKEPCLFGLYARVRVCTGTRVRVCAYVLVYVSGAVAKHLLEWM